MDEPDADMSRTTEAASSQSGRTLSRLLSVTQAAFINKLLPAGIKLVAEDEKCNFEVESDDEGHI